MREPLYLLSSFQLKRITSFYSQQYSTSEEVKFLLIIFFTYIPFYHVYSIDAKKVGTTNHFCSKPNPTFLYKVFITESRVFVCNIHFVWNTLWYNIICSLFSFRQVECRRFEILSFSCTSTSGSQTQVQIA